MIITILLLNYTKSSVSGWFTTDGKSLSNFTDGSRDPDGEQDHRPAQTAAAEGAQRLLSHRVSVQWDHQEMFRQIRPG